MFQKTITITVSSAARTEASRNRDYADALRNAAPLVAFGMAEGGAKDMVGAHDQANDHGFSFVTSVEENISTEEALAPSC